EQISTASKEASGTSNMKCISNGAIILGTMDGANVEIADCVGKENMAIFGLTAEEVIRYQNTGSYSSWHQYHQIPAIKSVVDQLINGFFPADTNFWDIYNSLLIDNDPYFILQDFPTYLTTVNQLSQLYLNQEKWQRCSLMNIANSGFFSSDRTIKEYANEIWHVAYKK
ncbi:MAG: glycogen/starch/alpha-glucan phosphorylase, partial [Evtepia sp.]